MTFAGEAKGASCGEQSMLRLQQGIEGLVGRKNSISPGCHREKGTLEQNGNNHNYCLLTAAYKYYSRCFTCINSLNTLLLEGEYGYSVILWMKKLSHKEFKRLVQIIQVMSCETGFKLRSFAFRAYTLHHHTVQPLREVNTHEGEWQQKKLSSKTRVEETMDIEAKLS